jgi:hypothetical protein
LQFRQPDDLSDDIVVDQEMLAKGFAGKWKRSDGG